MYCEKEVVPRLVELCVQFNYVCCVVRERESIRASEREQLLKGELFIVGLKLSFDVDIFSP
jgi:hypothetical protein